MRGFWFFLAALPLLAQSAPRTIQVPSSTGWVDTGIDVSAGDLYRFTSTGSVKYADASQAASPDGIPRGWRDLVRALPMNDTGRGALIARIGTGDAARPFFVGPRLEMRMLTAGRLFLGLNQPANGAGEGSFSVTLELIAKADSNAQAFTGKLPDINDSLLARIPRRVVDKDGNEGDRVNFLLLGTEEQVKRALLNVGWVVVDRSVKDSILRGALGTFSKQAYLTMPMSELMVFGRAQDYGFAMSDPLKTVAARHHFRIWKAPFQAGNLTLWVGAGTHDTGFDKDQRTGGITHKIDPDTDLEREFIGETLKHSGQVVKTAYVTPKDTITKAKTAHGQEFHSDGRILILYLKPETGDLTTGFADTFCSVLTQNNPDGEDFGTCQQWLQTPGKSDLKLGAIPNTWRILVVPGIMNTCVSKTPAFDKGRQVLKDKYGIAAEILSVPNDSSESNAKAIAAYIIEQRKTDNRQFIVIGYSKGTPDMQTALALEPGVKEAVAAFISVAGASGGSPIADTLPMQIDAYLSKVKQGGCQGDLSAGFKSLKKEVRQRFLQQYPHPLVPTYSLAAVIPEERIPKMAAQTFKILSAWDKFNDSQLLKLDQFIPESKTLGTVLSDHLNVALAMNERFPRAALLESLVRLVTADLSNGKPQPVSKPAAAPDNKGGWGPQAQPENKGGWGPEPEKKGSWGPQN